MNLICYAQIIYILGSDITCDAQHAVILGSHTREVHDWYLRPSRQLMMQILRGMS